MIIEQNTNYAYKLKYIEQPCFDKVRRLAVQFIMELPQQLRNELFEALNHGIDILDSEPQMVTYLHSFGQMHQAKLQYAFGKLPDEFLQQNEINIIDYGCGQAIGTMCYADYLRDNGYSQKVKTITLMEPSEICLKRAALHASVFFPDAEIKTVNKKFEALTKEDIECDEDVPTIHILSNVLDLDFDLDCFASLVKNNLKGYNQFVCVGPYFGSSDKGKRMEYFCSLLEGDKGFYGTFDKYELVEDKTWTAQVLCFIINDNVSLLFPYIMEHPDLLPDIREIIRQAVRGNAEAQYKLGEKICMWIYNKTTEKAFEWYEKAARKGHPLAQLEVGESYYQGWCGVIQDYEKAVEWFSKAAEQKNAMAQFRLGDCYYYGRGVCQNFENAVKWYKKSARQGHIEACHSLADCYSNGVGVTQNREIARYWNLKYSVYCIRTISNTPPSIETFPPLERPKVIEKADLDELLKKKKMN